MDIDEILLAHGHKKQSIDSDTTPPSPITQFVATAGNNQITLNWINPTDADFVGTRIQRSTTSYPTSPTDGATIFNGGGASFIDAEAISGTTYYYSAFPYDGANNFNTNSSQRVSAASITYKIYTVIIDTNNSNPSTSVTYADDAVGMVAGSSNWDNIFPYNEIKPVLFLNGAVNTYLNPNNFAQRADGTTVNITNGTLGDVMIQFPKVYAYIRKVGNLTYVSLSKDKVNANYKCYAHTKSGIEKDYLYIGAYHGTISSSRLRSLSGVTGATNINLSTFRTNATANGTGYQLYSYYQHLMVQVLYLIKYKNLNSQSTIGRGYVSSSNAAPIANGTMNTRGMTYGDTAYGTTGGMKLFGIENLWGSLFQFTDGILLKSDFELFISSSNDNFNDSATGYTSYSTINDLLGYINDVFGTTELGFFPSSTDASSTTYYSDSCFLSNDTPSSDHILLTGSDWNSDNGDSEQAGIFYTDMWYPSNITKAGIGARLTYL